MQNPSEAIGRTALQEHTLAMKVVLEDAAEQLSEFEWLAFAAVTAQALKKQRPPR